jgi:hypothetical protein
VRAHPLQGNHLQRHLLSLIVIADPSIDHAAETSPNHIVKVEAERTNPLFHGLGGMRQGLFLAIALVEGAVRFRRARLPCILVQ